MNKLTVTLKQHTPLIHFQHNQEGATLRASEVKPKLDKYLIKHVFGDKKEVYKKYLIGNGDHPALDYKLEVRAYNAKNLKIIEKEEKKKGVLQKSFCGEQLYSTKNYPDDNNSLLMSNMGGKIKSEIANFSFSDKIELVFRSRNSDLLSKINMNIGKFVASRNFGQRTSKGFGSFEVKAIDNIAVEYNTIADFFLTFSIKNERKDIDAYKDIFRVVNQLWKELKRYNGSKSKSNLDSVLLGESLIDTKAPERIPSPIIFKPVVYKDKNIWEITVFIILDEIFIEKALGPNGIIKLNAKVKRVLLDNEENIKSIVYKNIAHELLDFYVE